jgi:hypothetical protein
MRERRSIDDARRLSPRREGRIAGKGLLPASEAERRPPAGVEGDRGSTWPGGPNPRVSRAEIGRDPGFGIVISPRLSKSLLSVSRFDSMCGSAVGASGAECRDATGGACKDHLAGFFVDPQGSASDDSRRVSP